MEKKDIVNELKKKSFAFAWFFKLSYFPSENRGQFGTH